MKITSPAFADKIPLPVVYTCSGSDQSPPLEFLDVPKEAKSLVLLVEDIDAEKPLFHWLVYNIPAEVTHFDEGKTPTDAIEGICNSGEPGYKGPCPKLFTGIHRYCFRLYALDAMLQIPAVADAPAVLAEIEGHILDKAELLGVAEGEKISESIG
jgi:Raf kinase inhibitor-like YbhB/YbcL family protein